ncbi:MAG: acylphosphatase [Saprospiraceae bacterium]
MDQITIQIHISGKVQGVWFRATAKDIALSLGLKGKVWNNPDDSVGVIVSGSQNNIEEFIAWCRKGPTLAKVENVTYSELEIDVELTTFEISRR